MSEKVKLILESLMAFSLAVCAYIGFQVKDEISGLREGQAQLSVKSDYNAKGIQEVKTLLGAELRSLEAKIESKYSVLDARVRALEKE